jgi:hypothetical protein
MKLLKVRVPAHQLLFLPLLPRGEDEELVYRVQKRDF